MNELDASWAASGGEITTMASGERYYGDCDLDWTIKRSPTYFDIPDEFVPNGKRKEIVPERHTLYHSVTEQPLGIVSPRFKVVQPIQVIKTFEHMAKTQNMNLRFAGSAHEGKKLWGLADTGKELRVRGTDQQGLYFMFVTACDGTMSTTGVFTTIRAFCMNMLNLVMNEGLARIKVPHSQEYNPVEFSKELEGGFQMWNEYQDAAEKLAERNVSAEEVAKFLVNVFGNPELKLDDEKQPGQRAMKRVLELYHGDGRGATERSSKGTAFGLVQATTEFIDYHRKAKNDSTRFTAAAFGSGNRTKNKAWTEALRLVA